MKTVVGWVGCLVGILALWVTLGAGSVSFASERAWEIESLERDLKALEQRYKEKHPDVRALRRRLERLKTEAQAESTLRRQGTVPWPQGEAMPGRGEGAGEEAVSKIRQIPMEVRDLTGLGFENWPVSTVLPLPYGWSGDTRAFRVVDGLGRTVPAQFSILSGRWADEGRRRHLMVHFMATVAASRTEGGGSGFYVLMNGALASEPFSGLLVEETPSTVTVVTGPLKFVVDRRGQEIFRGVWLDRDRSGRFEGDEALVMPQSSFLTSERRLRGEGPHGKRVIVEEAGPVRAVLRVEIPEFRRVRGDSPKAVTIWITAYAGHSFIEITTHQEIAGREDPVITQMASGSSPLRFPLALAEPVRVTVGLGDGTYLRQERGPGVFLVQDGFDRFRLYDRPGGTHLRTGRKADGFLDVSGRNHGVAAIVRDFVATWPNGIAVDADNLLTLATTSQRGTYRAPAALAATFHTGTLSGEPFRTVSVKRMALFFHSATIKPEAILRLAFLLNNTPEVSSPVWWTQGLDEGD